MHTNTNARNEEGKTIWLTVKMKITSVAISEISNVRVLAAPMDFEGMIEQ
jgi:hypothetical protein